MPTIDADTQVLPVLGTKEALYSFTQTIVDPTRERPTVLVPNPFYMVYEGAALLCGAKPYFVNFDATTGEYAWDAVPGDRLAGCAAADCVLAGQSTGAITSRGAGAGYSEKSDRYGFVILADECYSEIYFDEASPPVGALQVAAEMGRADFRRLVAMGSLSKRSNAPGFCSGFVAGDATLMAAFLKLRSFNGSAMAGTVVAASIDAWNDEARMSSPTGRPTPENFVS